MPRPTDVRLATSRSKQNRFARKQQLQSYGGFQKKRTQEQTPLYYELYYGDSQSGGIFGSPHTLHHIGIWT